MNEIKMPEIKYLILIVIIKSFERNCYELGHPSTRRNVNVHEKYIASTQSGTCSKGLI
jgi:hypothetical protein